MADRNLRILILEAGPTTQNDPAHLYPMQCRKHRAPGSHTTRTYVGRPSASLGGRSAIIRTGQCLGGGGSVNCAFLFLLLPCAVPLRTRNKDDDGLTLKCGWMGVNCLIRFVKQTCSTPVRVPLTTTTGRRCTRTLGGAQTSLFRCSERLVKCALEYTGGTISIFSMFGLCNRWMPACL